MLPFEANIRDFEISLFKSKFMTKNMDHEQEEEEWWKLYISLFYKC